MSCLKNVLDHLKIFLRKFCFFFLKNIFFRLENVLKFLPGATMTQGSGALSETVASGAYSSYDFYCSAGQWQCSASSPTDADCVDDYCLCPQFGSSPACAVPTTTAAVPTPATTTLPPPPTTTTAVPTTTAAPSTGCEATVYDPHHLEGPRCRSDLHWKLRCRLRFYFQPTRSCNAGGFWSPEIANCCIGSFSFFLWFLCSYECRLSHIPPFE